MTSGKYVLLAGLLLLCFLGVSAQIMPSPPVFYVSTSGDDANPGTLSAPVRTIQHAANLATPGSTVYVRGGTYEERVTVNVSGNAGDGFITFSSYPGETAILDGQHLTPDGRSGMVLIQNKSYVRIQGF
jgi:hypothetical protein